MEKKKKQINEYDSMKLMLNTVRKLTEQTDTKYNQDKSAVVSDDPASNTTDTNEYEFSGEKVIVHDSKEITDPEKNTFLQSIDNFHKQVTDMVEFNPLHIRENDVQWSGKLIKFDLTFFYLFGEKNGVYLKGDMIKVDDEFTKLLTQLSEYYKNFSSSWSPVLSDRRNLSKEN